MFQPSGAPIAFPRVRESGTASPSLARLKPLLEIANLVRDERELEDVLESIAETISTGLGWRTVVVNLYRPAWDDFHVTTVFGNDDARRARGMTGSRCSLIASSVAAPTSCDTASSTGGASSCRPSFRRVSRRKIRT